MIIIFAVGTAILFVLKACLNELYNSCFPKPHYLVLSKCNLSQIEYNRVLFRKLAVTHVRRFRHQT